VIVWDVIGGQPLQTLRGHAHAVAAGALVPGSDKLFTGGFDGEVLVWTRDTGLLGYLKVPSLLRDGSSFLDGCGADSDITDRIGDDSRVR
jgi:WD40 repeat protein